ncbi:MAG: hypothetical protein M3415_04915 [Actinomycetota bacterium]|nr:hypothetical protein [Actinomycetota bacterium]
MGAVVIKSKVALRALAVTSFVILATAGWSEPQPAEVVGAVTSEATSDDALTAAVADGLSETRLLPGSERLLRRDGDVRHYVATNVDGELCLVAVIVTADNGDVAASTCARPSDVRDHGLPLHLRAGDVGTFAVLVPDGYDSARRSDGRGQIKVTNNVVSVDAAATSGMPDDIVVQPQRLGDPAIQVPVRQEGRS